MAENTDKLLARADAALAEARRLFDINEEWQRRTSDRLLGIFSRFSAIRASEGKSHYPRKSIEQPLPSASLTNLAEAERDITLGEQHLARQEAVVVELGRDHHHDPHQAKEILATMRQSQIIHLELARILRELDDLRSMYPRSVDGEA